MRRTALYIILIFVLFSGSLYAQHLKKDGTPDMRYKENKTTVSTPSPAYTPATSSNFPSSTPHLKKDGTLDKRYKENKRSTPTYTIIATPVPKYEPNEYSYTVKRDSKGKIVRSATEKYQFMKETGYTKGRPGYVVDHIIPLKKGGCDCASNMQWQTVADAKAKDKIE